MRETFISRFDGPLHSYVCELAPTNSGKQRGWYIYRQRRHGETRSALKKRMLDYPLFSATQAAEIAAQLAAEEKTTALLRGLSTD